MIDGQGYNWTTEKGIYTGMPSYEGTSTITGNIGDGYAKITFIEETEKNIEQEGIYITEVNYLPEESNNVTNQKTPKTDQTILSSEFTLSEETNSQITYEITIYNSTDKTYYFDNVYYAEMDDNSAYTNENITYNITNLKEDDELKPNTKITFKITFTYKDTTNITDTYLKSYLNFNFKETKKEYVLNTGANLASKISSTTKIVIFDNWYNSPYNSNGNITYESMFDWNNQDNDTTNDGVNIATGIVDSGKIVTNSQYNDKIKVFTSDTTVYILSKGKIVFNENSSAMFKDKTSITMIFFNNIDTSYMTNTSQMFYGCTSLSILRSFQFNTAKVTNMSQMFYNNTRLATLDLTSFNTQNVTNTSQMFYGCTNLQTIYATSNFTTNKITSSTNMFYNNTKLVGGNGTTYNASYLDKTYARIDQTSTKGYFTYEDKIMLLSGQELNYKIKKSYSAQNYNVKNIVFDYFNNHSEKLNWDEYESCVDVNNQCTIRLFRKWFSDNQYDVYILSENKMYANYDSSLMFYNVRGVENIEFNNFDTQHVATFRQMFYMYDTTDNTYSSSIKSLDLSMFNTSNVTNTRAMFSYSPSLESINLSNWDTSNVKEMAYMFQTCENLKSIDLTHFDTSQVYDMEGMFMRCSSLTELDLSSFDTSNVTDMHWMFSMKSTIGDSNNAKLKTIYVSNKFVTSSVNISTDLPLFEGCINLVGGNGTTYNENNIYLSYAKVDTKTTPGYFTLK